MFSIKYMHIALLSITFLSTLALQFLHSRTFCVHCTFELDVALSALVLGLSRILSSI